MKVNANTFLNKQDREERKEQRTKKKRKIYRDKYGFGCHVRFDLPVLDNETTFSFALSNETVYKFLDNPCDNEITIKKYLQSYDKNNKNNQKICLSQNMLIKFKNTINDKIYKELKDKIEILKLFAVYRSEYEIQYAIMYTEKITFKEQFNQIILEVFMKSTSESFIQKIQFYEKNGVNLKYIIYDILDENKNSELFTIIDTIYQDYLNYKKIDSIIIKED